ASSQYPSVHSRSKEDHHDTDDASSGKIYDIFVPQSRLSAIQSAQCRQHWPSLLDGKHKHIERLRCTVCEREFSEREGTLMARRKLEEDRVERLLKCQGGGVCDEGTADICAVDLKTVYRFQRVATRRAQTHHQQVVQAVDVPGVQLDEAHSKLRPKQV